MFMSDCVTDRQLRHYEHIPSKTDILITHIPPYGILDFDDNINYGSEELLLEVHSINPTLHF